MTNFGPKSHFIEIPFLPQNVSKVSEQSHFCVLVCLLPENWNTNFSSEFQWVCWFFKFTNFKFWKYNIFENPHLTRRFLYKTSSGWYSHLLTCTQSLVEIWVHFSSSTNNFRNFEKYNFQFQWSVVGRLLTGRFRYKTSSGESSALITGNNFIEIWEVLF